MFEAYGQRPGWNHGVLGHVKQEIVVRGLNGVLVTPSLPSRESWGAMLQKYAPGCGSPTHVAGTNGGRMPCGGWLTELSGARHQQFCPRLENELKRSSSPVVQSLADAERRRPFWVSLLLRR